MKASAAERLPIRTICSLTGVNPVTLRAWERRYGLVRPMRTPSGHRLYTREHVELIRRVLALVERGVPISRVRDQLEAEPRPRGRARGHGLWRDYVELMTAAIARFDEPELDRLYDQALSFHPIEHVTRDLLLALLRDVGERWKILPGGVAEEHFFAAYMRGKLGARLQHRMRYASGTRIVAACAPGEQHEIGLILFALEAHEAGLRTVLLGADTPFLDLAIAQRQSGSRAIVISSTLDPAPGLLERALPKLVRQVRVPVFVGGGTAIRHRQVIAAAGAIPAGIELEDGVRLILATLGREGSKE
jgi:DNA-binding transcriptional MerR regulator